MLYVYFIQYVSGFTQRVCIVFVVFVYMLLWRQCTNDYMCICMNVQIN